MFFFQNLWVLRVGILTAAFYSTASLVFSHKPFILSAFTLSTATQRDQKSLSHSKQVLFTILKNLFTDSQKKNKIPTVFDLTFFVLFLDVFTVSFCLKTPKHSFKRRFLVHNKFSSTCVTQCWLIQKTISTCPFIKKKQTSGLQWNTYNGANL